MKNQDMEPWPAAGPLQLPLAPLSVRDSGLDTLFLAELLCKQLYGHGQLRLQQLADLSKLSLTVLEAVLAFLRAEQLIEVTGRQDGEGSTRYQLTEQGRSRARLYLQKSRYAGPAPVTLAAYCDMVRRASVSQMAISRQQVMQSFDGFVMRQQTLDIFGAAMNSGRAIFVYGPAGSGKTYLAEHLARLLCGACAVPYAVLVEGEVIQLFDPLIHQPLSPAGSDGGLDKGVPLDRRWVLCQRPVVLTGGELTLAMLDLQLDEQSRFYQAPPQLKANNGLLIIDDLGRQLVPAQQLMNRWIVPLDRRIDYLALHTGSKFLVPFDVVVVFSSNQPPQQLADEAFLRRLGYKIHIGALHEDEYRAIFQQHCQRLDIAYHEEALRFLLDTLHRHHDKPLLACLPRDLLEQVRDRARYLGVAPLLDAESLTWAWHNYFARDQVHGWPQGECGRAQ